MRRALFLDRDGIINVDRDYVYRIEDFEWQPGIFDLARTAQRERYAIVVVTNQSGIGRGYYSEDDFRRLTDHMTSRFEAEGAAIAAVFHCPFHPVAAIEAYRHPDHPWRKPRPGMLLEAEARLNLDMPASIMIGDRPSDIEAGRSAGVGTLVLVGDADGAGCDPAVIRCSSVAGAAAWFAVEITRRK